MKFKIKSARLPFSVRNTLTLCLVLMVIGCDGLYQPISQPQPSSSDKNDTAGVSRLFAVNENQQICNPSASQDTVNFKGCMLFLNLEGTLTLNVPPEWETHYSLTADAHDRLTIVDTTNTVRWFLIKPNFLQQTSMQDPEWSRHPDYIAFLGDNDTASDGYIVRISDKKILKINNGLLQANSTPHLWLPDHFKGPSELLHDAVASPFSIAGASWDATRGMLDKETIKEYFGTDSVKFTFSKNKGSSGLTIYYIDYSLQNPHSIQIPRPQGRDGYDCESSLISPDGNWIVYNCKRGSLTCEAYIQYLGDSSEPVLLHDGTAAEPHWWVEPRTGAVFVLYSTKPGPLFEDLQKVAGDGSYGETLIRRITPGPKWLSFYDPESLLAPLPFQGGLTRDGRYLVTGYIYGYILGFPSIGN